MMTKLSNRISGARIAAELGISQATVSRALNGNPRISQAVRDQVQKTANRLGYVANATARTLVKGRSNLIGILTGGLQVERTANLLIALDAELRKHELLPHIFYTRSETNRIAEGVRHLLEQGVDGLIVIGIHPSAIKQLERENLLKVKPTVFIDDALNDYNINVITSDFTEAYGEIAKELKKQNKRNVFALWESAEDKDLSPVMYTRLLGLKKLLKDLEQEDNLIFLSSTIGPNVLFENDDLNSIFCNKIKLFLQKHPECDAIICFNDNVAFCVLGMLNHCQQKIPEDIAIVGYDNDQLGGRIEPGLSTISPQPILTAHAAVERLAELIDNPHDDSVIIKIPAKFIKRKTL
jgi:DNA-binding LacI/PurR family transcriptional regulator